MREPVALTDTYFRGCRVALIEGDEAAVKHFDRWFKAQVDGETKRMRERTNRELAEFGLAPFPDSAFEPLFPERGAEGR